MSFDLIDRKFRPTTGLTCARCERPGGIRLENSRTQYPFDGEIGSEADPNRAIPLCRECAADHHQHWDETWAEYWSGLI